MHVCSQFRHPWQTGQYWRPTFSGGVGSCRPALWPDSRQTSRTKNYLFNVVIIYVCYTTYYSLGRLPGYSGSRQLSGVGCQKRQPSLMADLLSARMSRPGLKFSSNHIRGILQKMAIGMLDIQYDTNWLPFLKNSTGMQLLTADIIYDTTVLWWWRRRRRQRRLQQIVVVLARGISNSINQYKKNWKQKEHTLTIRAT